MQATEKSRIDARVAAVDEHGRLLDKVTARLGIPEDRSISVIERYGNTSSSSLPITLDAALQGGHIKTGDLVLLAAIGSGLTWGTALIKW